MAMDTRPSSLTGDRYLEIEGLRTRYIEAGSGHPVLLMHGASLGSSADVFRRNLGPLAEAGFRAIAFDFPGFGLSEVGEDLSLAFQQNRARKFIDALGLKKPAIIAHSRGGSIAVRLALLEPDRYSHLVVLGTGSLLPPLPDDVEGRYARVAQRVDRQMSLTAPSSDDTRALMQADLFHAELATEEEVVLRHARSIGQAFEIFKARANVNDPAAKDPSTTTLWERMLDIQVPLLLIYGRNDRAHAADRATLLKTLHPELDLHVIDGCRHMVPWDAEQDLYRLAVPFMKEMRNQLTPSSVAERR